MEMATGLDVSIKEKKKYNQPMKFIRIFLLILIILGVWLLATQKTWVPKVVDWIVEQEAA